METSALKGPTSNPRLGALPTRHASNGIALRTLGDGPPLLLVHGGSGSWLHWWRNIEPLSMSHRVIAIDLPGFGESNDVPADISVDEYVGMVTEAAREAAGSVRQIDVVGFSFGAFIGCGVAALLGVAARHAV